VNKGYSGFFYWGWWGHSIKGEITATVKVDILFQLFSLVLIPASTETQTHFVFWPSTTQLIQITKL
jgi:hypothetical protein